MAKYIQILVRFWDEHGFVIGNARASEISSIPEGAVAFDAWVYDGSFEYPEWKDET